MEMDNVETIKRAVELGVGVSVLPAATVQHEVAQGTLVAKPFADGNYTRPIGLLVRKGKYLDRASQAVLDAFKSAAGQPRSELAGGGLLPRSCRFSSSPRSCLRCSGRELLHLVAPAVRRPAASSRRSPWPRCSRRGSEGRVGDRLRLHRVASQVAGSPLLPGRPP